MREDSADCLACHPVEQRLDLPAHGGIRAAEVVEITGPLFIFEAACCMVRPLDLLPPVRLHLAIVRDFATNNPVCALVCLLIVEAVA